MNNASLAEVYTDKSASVLGFTCNEVTGSSSQRKAPSSPVPGLSMLTRSPRGDGGY